MKGGVCCGSVAAFKLPPTLSGQFFSLATNTRKTNMCIDWKLQPLFLLMLMLMLMVMEVVTIMLMLLLKVTVTIMLMLLLMVTVMIMLMLMLAMR